MHITFFFYNVKTVCGTTPATESFRFRVFFVFFFTIIYDDVRVCLLILSFQFYCALRYGTLTVNNRLFVLLFFFSCGVKWNALIFLKSRFKKKKKILLHNNLVVQTYGLVLSLDMHMLHVFFVFLNERSHFFTPVTL